MSLARSTLRALLEPKRLVPILVVCVPLVFAQRSYSRDPRAVVLGLLMCASFVLLAPVSWRVLLPEGARGSDALLRLALYAGLGAGAVLGVGVVVPRLWGMGTTFLTARTSLMIDVALFLVGGWGLGRDIGMEASLRRAEERARELAREAERAQLLALRAHLDPHFLFNTLNAIAEWCRTDGETAERAVLELASMLRVLLEGIQERAWPLGRELDLCRSLVALHRMRDPDRFDATWEVPDDARSVLVPPLVLLPLVENAVKHGPARGHAGRIALSIAQDDGALRVELRSPGPYRGPRAGSHGLPTVERRLALAYRGAASLAIGDAGDDATRVTVILPLLPLEAS